MKVFFILDTDYNELVDANHPGTLVCFLSRVAADAEADYLNNKAPSAELRDRYAVKVTVI